VGTVPFTGTARDYENASLGKHCMMIYENTCDDWTTALLGAVTQSVVVATSYVDAHSLSLFFQPICIFLNAAVTTALLNASLSPSPSPLTTTTNHHHHHSTTTTTNHHHHY
jgi:hypothetical protein